MKETSVAQRYARALFLAVGETKSIKVESIRSGLEEISRKIDSDPQWKAQLENPIMSLEEKKKLIRNRLKITTPLLLNFMDLLIIKKRTGLISLILKRFEDTVEEAQGRIRASVKAATELDASTKSEMEKNLASLFKKEVSLDITVVPELLAGVIVKAGDTVIDGSLRSRLKNLKSILQSQDYGTDS